jgi:hypothetical protein
MAPGGWQRTASSVAEVIPGSIETGKIARSRTRFQIGVAPGGGSRIGSSPASASESARAPSARQASSAPARSAPGNSMTS